MAKSLLTLVPRAARYARRRLRWLLRGRRGEGLTIPERAALIAELVKPLGLRGREWAELFREAEKLGVHVLPVGFYSPVPDTRELAANRHRWDKESDFSAVNYDYAEQDRLGQTFRQYQGEYGSMPTAEGLKAQGLGQGYGEIEALLLHAFIRHLKPARIIEVGSGVSTCYSAHALELNAKEGRGGTITCIEPFPTEQLRKAAFNPPIVDKCVQDVEPAFFQQLEAGDVLFIDSSHAVKIGSDVNYLLLEIVPSLKAGVFVHIHDIPFPRVTSREYWIFEHATFWQEAVLLKALLTNNPTLKVLYSSSFLFYKDPQALKATFPSFDPFRHFPSAIWIEKIKVP